MEIRFDGKRALVTGAGRGIGREIAKMFVKCGAETFALSKTQENLDSLKAEVPAIHTVQADLQDWESTRKVVEQLGPIDLLVNNAAAAGLFSFTDVTEKEIDSMFAVNLKAVINVSQVVVKGMIERGQGGAIVNMSSVASSKALMGHTVYSATKAGLDILSKTMCLELGPHKIRVNTVNPTVVWTDMGKFGWSDPSKSGPILARIPLNKFAGPCVSAVVSARSSGHPKNAEMVAKHMDWFLLTEIEDVANTTMFLLSDKAAMINGSTILVDGGYSVG